MSLLTPQEPQGILGDLLAQFGYSMLAGKGNLGQNIGNAGLANLQYRQQQEQLQRERQRQALQDQLLKGQVTEYEQASAAKEAERQRQQQLRGMQTNFARLPQPMQELDPRQQEGGQEFLPAQPGGFDMRGYAQAAQARGLMSPMEAAQLNQRENPFNKVDIDKFTPQSIARFQQTQNYADLQPQAKPEERDALGKLISTRDKLPPNHPSRRLYDAAIRKATHVPEDGGGKAQWDSDRGVWVDPRARTLTPGVVDGKPVGPKDKTKSLTESQAKASAFLGQMRSANDQISNIEAGGFNPAEAMNPIAVAMAENRYGNIVAPAAAQKYSQAQNQWSEAYLRFKTGAAATENEVSRNVRTFFPVAGDSKQVIAQKAMMRQQAQQDMAIAAGAGADQAKSIVQTDPLSMRGTPENDPLGIRR